MEVPPKHKNRPAFCGSASIHPLRALSEVTVVPHAFAITRDVRHADATFPPKNTMHRYSQILRDIPDQKTRDARGQRKKPFIYIGKLHQKLRFFNSKEKIARPALAPQGLKGLWKG